MENNEFLALSASLSGINLAALVPYQPLQPSDGKIVTRPKQSEFGSVTPYTVRAVYTHYESCIWSRYNVQAGERVLIDERLLLAGTVCGIPPVYWPDLDWALKTDGKPFEYGFFGSPGDANRLSWIEVGKKIVAYLGETFLPPLAPVWLRHLGYDEAMYAAKLSAFWEVGSEYPATWGTQRPVAALGNSPILELKARLGITS